MGKLAGGRKSGGKANLVKLPPGVSEEELILWAPLLTKPPMMNYQQLTDGSTSLEDILEMNNMIQWKAEVDQAAQDDD